MLWGGPPWGFRMKGGGPQALVISRVSIINLQTSTFYTSKTTN